jgi:hypothetical protein
MPTSANDFRTTDERLAAAVRRAQASFGKDLGVFFRAVRDSIASNQKPNPRKVRRKEKARHACT